MPNPPTNTDHGSKTRKSASTSSAGSSGGSSGQSAVNTQSTAAKPPSGKVGGQPHPQLSHPQQPLPGQPSASSSSNENSLSSGAQLHKESNAVETGKTPGSVGGVVGSGAAVGRGGVAGSAAGGDHVTPSKTPAGIVTATALNQRQATHSTPNQGVCVCICVKRERDVYM